MTQMHCFGKCQISNMICSRQVTASWVEFRGTDNFNIRTLEAMYKQMTAATPPVANADASLAKRQRFAAKTTQQPIGLDSIWQVQGGY